MMGMRRTSCLHIALTFLFSLPPHVSCSSGGGPETDADGAEDAAGEETVRLELPDLAAEAAEAVQIVPSPGLPDEAEPQAANNNLDIIDFEGRLFLAFRTAPNHYASPDTRMHVVSSTDEASWDFEATFFMGTDLREPEFLDLEGRLFLYFAVLGSDPTNFDPQGMMAVERLGPGLWTEPRWSYLEGFIPWRARMVDGRAFMIGYVGGENIYDPGDPNIDIHWITTADGLSWEPVIPDRPVVLHGGGSEADFAFLPDGSLAAVVRNEKGDAMGFGSKICRAEAASLGDWTCAIDPRKYDSPLLFTHEGAVVLIGRRNVTETGNYDLGMSHLSLEEQYIQYELDYVSRPKRCSLWQVDPYALTVTFLADLPSLGDTCFPSMVPRGPGEVLVYNYSSPLYGPDLDWKDGQLGPTAVYGSMVYLDAL
jgi:hypothetical protein